MKILGKEMGIFTTIALIALLIFALFVVVMGIIEMGLWYSILFILFLVVFVGVVHENIQKK